MSNDIQHNLTTAVADFLNNTDYRKNEEVSWDPWLDEYILANKKPRIFSANTPLASNMREMLDRDNQLDVTVKAVYGGIKSAGYTYTGGPGDISSKPPRGTAVYGEGFAKTHLVGEWFVESDVVKMLSPNLSIKNQLLKLYTAWKYKLINRYTYAILHNLILIDNILINKNGTISSFPAMMDALEDLQNWEEIDHYSYRSKIKTQIPIYMNRKTRKALLADSTSKVKRVTYAAAGGTHVTPATYQDNEYYIMYDQRIPVVVFDYLPDNYVFRLKDELFGVASKKDVSALKGVHPGKIMYEKEGTTGGFGVESIGYKAAFAIHPAGFNFIGKQGTDFATNEAVTLAEFHNNKKMYELSCNPENATVGIIKIA